MRSISLVLGAAAGVNAILGGNIESVVISDQSFICALDCVYQGVFFGTRAACPEKEAIIAVGEDGEDSIDVKTGSAFICTGQPLSPIFGLRQPANGEAPEQCEVRKYTDRKQIGCLSLRESGGSGGENMEWSEVEKLLKAAQAQDTPQQNKPAPQGSQHECAQIASTAFQKCRKTKYFTECEQEGRATLEKCLGKQ